MSNKNTGGPAFPCDGDIKRIFTGMTLRDYFAGQALAGIMTSYAVARGPSEQWIDAAAKISFLVADAMLQERDK